MAKINKGKVTFENEASEPKFGYVKGEAQWAQVLEPDQFGNYSINLYGDAVAELKEELEAMRDSAYDEIIDLGKKAQKVDVLKQDDEGNYYIGFKLPETNYEGKPNSIKIYNATGNLEEDWDKLIGNGSVVKVKYRVSPYYMASTKNVGLSFKFYAVQVIDLNEYNKGDEGFTDETGGKDMGDSTNDATGEDF